MCEGYGKLIGVIVAHWMLLVAGWQQDRLSALDALHILRHSVGLIHRAFTYFSVWAEVFADLREDLAASPRRARRGKTPLTFQLWYDFEVSYA